MKQKLLFIFALLCAVAQGAWSQNVVDLSTLTSDYTAQDGDVLTGVLNDVSQPYQISIADGASITLRDATIAGCNEETLEIGWFDEERYWTNPFAGLTCLGDATITLEGTNSVKGFGHYYPGIMAGPVGKTLTIRGTGSLDVKSQGYGAGIGSGHRLSPCGNIVIESGTISVDGWGGPGIGAGEDSSCGDITIKGGYITAKGAPGIGANQRSDYNCGIITIKGGEIHAEFTDGLTNYLFTAICGGDGIYIYDGTVYTIGGIGCPEKGDVWIGGGEIHIQGRLKPGICSYGRTITIDGGTIYANGGPRAAGIGGCEGDHGGSIYINGGTIVAKGGKRAAGIGGGKDGTGGNIFIYGGTVEAYGGEYGAGIGGGINGRGGAIWITGGTVKAYGGTDAAGIGGGESGNSGSIVINGGDVYASGDGYGVGIGAGEDGDVDNTISINGGIVDVYGGLEIRRAIGGEDDEDYANISIGDRVKVTNISSSGNYTLNYTFRNYNLDSYLRLKFESCDHAGASYSITDGTKHHCVCMWCGVFDEDHHLDENGKCYCGYGLPTHVVHIYEYGSNYQYYEANTLTVAEGNDFTLPLTAGGPDNYLFSCWVKGEPKTDEGGLLSDYETQYESGSTQTMG